MTKSYRDHLGRPVVAVTGTGVVTSLGVGKDDNWAALTAGQSGIRAITRFATDGLSTRIAGTVDFLYRAVFVQVDIGAEGKRTEVDLLFQDIAGQQL